jgi:hypothetical protein
MESVVEVLRDPTLAQQANGAGAARLPRRARTRQGKVRLLTLDVLDARTAAAQAARELIAQLAADLYPGEGEDQLTAGERQLVHRAALTGAIAADFEARWVIGQDVALADYLQAVNVQRRVLATLGIERRQRLANPEPYGDLNAVGRQRARQELLPP